MTIWGSGAVSSAEEAGSMQESYNDELGLMSASVTLRCAYADRHALVADIVGARLPWPKGNVGVTPLAATASIVPVISPPTSGSGTDGELIIYRESLVTINYSSKVVDTYSESIEPFGEFLTLDHRWFWWGPLGGGTGGSVIPDLLREEEAPGRQMNGINFVRTDLNLSTVDQNLIDLVGYVNSDPVTWSTLSLSSAEETLLYTPPQISVKHDSTNTTLYDVTKKFTYQPNGWNKYFRSKTGAWSYIYVAGTATPYKSYPPTTFSGVLL